jgi:hypothetical protein
MRTSSKRNVWFLAVMLSVLLGSCAMLDSASDITVILLPPNQVIIDNTARVSTLRELECTIYRARQPMHTFHTDVDLVVGSRKTILLDGFILQDGDEVVIRKADLTWSM